MKHFVNIALNVSRETLPRDIKMMFHMKHSRELTVLSID